MQINISKREYEYGFLVYKGVLIDAVLCSIVSYFWVFTALQYALLSLL